MTPKNDHEDDMSMEEILASIRKFVTDSHPEEPKQKVYKEDLTESIVIPPAGHMPISQPRDYRQPENYPQPPINFSPPSVSPHEPDVLELKSPILPSRSAPPSNEWRVPPIGSFEANPRDSIITLTDPIPSRKEERPVRPPLRNVQEPEGGETLGSSQTVSASLSSLSRLAQASKSAFHKKTSNLADQRDLTLDQLIQNMVRPMVKMWIDTHLPSLVEEMVAKEIKRITSHLK